MRILGIDTGTTGIGAALYDSETGEVTETLSLPNKSFIESGAEYERIQDPGIILDTVREITEKTYGFDAIGISGQMHGILYIDKNGSAVSPLYTWQDTRSALPYKDGRSYAEHLGVYPGYGLATDFYNRENGLVPETAAYLCTIGDYIAMKLCSAEKPLMHITNAASLGCFDVFENRFTSDTALLPEVTGKYETTGYYKGNIPVTVCIGDNQASFLGSVPSDDAVLINVGTGAQISYIVDRDTALEIAGDPASGAEIRPYDGKKYLAAGCSLCGGRAFSAFEKFCRAAANAAGAEIDSFYPFLDKMLERGDTDLTADCRFSGTRKNPGLTGGFSNLTELNFTPRDFALAVSEGIVTELRGMYSGKENPLIVASGNGVRKNPAIKRYIEKHFGTVPVFTDYEEEAAVGAAKSAALSI